MPRSFMDHMTEDVFKERVYIFTPRGDIVDLPAGATPVDFAYSIHTEIGHRCRGAKIQGKLKALNYVLKNGDQVEIMTAKRGGPSMDWLNEDLGYVKTTRARSKIKHWFRKQNREQHITLGRSALEREMKRLSVLDKMSFETVANLLGHTRVDNFLACNRGRRYQRFTNHESYYASMSASAKMNKKQNLNVSNPVSVLP